MSEVGTEQTEVAFEVRQHGDGRPYIVLLLSRAGRPVSIDGKVFTFDLIANLATDEAATLAQVLNQCVTHIGMVRTEPEK
jgi:hypothetical protein